MQIRRNVDGQEHIFELTEDELRKAVGECSRLNFRDRICEAAYEVISEAFSMSPVDPDKNNIEFSIPDDFQSMIEEILEALICELNDNDDYWEWKQDFVKGIVEQEMASSGDDEDDLTIVTQDGVVEVRTGEKTITRVNDTKILICDAVFFQSKKNRERVSELFEEYEPL